MTVRTLLINGAPVPLMASLDVQQNYTPLQAVYRQRTADGTLDQTALWSGKLAVETVGSGRIPAGLAAVDFLSSFTLACISHRAINSASATITIPSARRADTGSTPYARALVGSTWIDAEVASLVGDVMTITPVTGASQYQAVWFPLLTVRADPPVESKSSRGPEFQWVLNAEQV